MSSTTDLRPYLRTLSVQALVELLCHQAERDTELRASLEARAAAAPGDLAEAHRLLDTVAAGGNFEYTTKVGSVLDTVQRLLDAGSRADLAPLARRTVDDIRRVLAQVDDSSGVVADELDRAVALYARACAAHPPDSDALADWLLATAFDGLEIELADFSEALGDKGIQRVKGTVDEVLAEGEDDPRQTTATRLREELAEISGDVDALVAILSAKPPRLDISLKIVRVLRSAGRHGEAIAHAAKALVHDKEPASAPAVREALPTEPSDLDPELRIEWAELHESAQPEEVIPVCRGTVESLIANKDPASYREAAKQLRKLRTLHKRADSTEEFTEYLATLVETHKRKTRLLAEIRAARIALPKAARG